MGKVKELQTDIQYIKNVLSTHGQGTAMVSFENVLSNLGYKPEPKVPMYGDTIENVQQLRHILKNLDDHDQLTLVTCDEDGDEHDHYPMALDVIDNIRLKDDTIVREVQFIQRPNCPKDTRDKRPLVDAVIKEITDDIVFGGDSTVLDELLMRIPYEILKNSLPEDQWEEFDAENVREALIDKAMRLLYSSDDLKYYDSNIAYLETLTDEEIQKKIDNY